MTDTFVSSNRWFSFPEPRPNATLRLFCLPYAGAGMAAYRPWASHLTDEIDLCLVNLPGRDARMGETPYTSVEALVADLSEAIAPLLDRPFAIFGHSMGALLSYALTRQIVQDYQLQPRHLFVSARRAPQIADPDPPLHQLPDAAFVVGMLRRYNGIPKALLSDIDLLKLFLPTIRADMTMIETYRFSVAKPLSIPMTAFGGWDDARATLNDLASWQELTTGQFGVRMFPGGHFYLQSQQAELLDAITTGLMAPVRYAGSTAPDLRTPDRQLIAFSAQLPGDD